MSNRLAHLLLLSTGLCTVGMVIAMSSPGIATRAQVVTPVSPPATIVARIPTMVLLPTIVVHPDRPVPTLATVTVHASFAHDGIDKPDTSANDNASEFDVASHTAVSALVSLPGSSFDMPYYSFGKSLRRVSKE